MLVMKISIPLILVSFLSLANLLHAISPVLLKRGDLIYKNDFSSGAVDKHWKVLQKTRFVVENGVLKGIPATAEDQAAKPDHNGPVGLIDYILEDQSFIVSKGLVKCADSIRRSSKNESRFVFAG